MRIACLISLGILIVGSIPNVSRAISREDLLVQTQAADLLGQSISGAVEQATKQAHPTTMPATTRPAAVAATTSPSISYHELFDQVAARIKKGDIVDDASLNNLDNAQLFGEMTALQTYNTQQFARLMQLSNGGATTTTTRPTLDSLLSGPKDAKWREKRQAMRNAVSARNAAARQRGGGSITDTVVQPAPGGGSNAAPTPPTWDDPRFHPYYYGPTDALTGWNDPFSDPFVFQNGGGVYRRTDTRVNRDYDPRVGGDFDRRINIDYDRRNNIHVDPRQNY